MPRNIRFHLDEHIALAVAEGLRRRGIDVTTTVDANLIGQADPTHLTHQQSRSIGQMIRALELIWEILEPEDMKDRVEFL